MYTFFVFTVPNFCLAGVDDDADDDTDADDDADDDADTGDVNVNNSGFGFFVFLVFFLNGGVYLETVCADAGPALFLDAVLNADAGTGTGAGACLSANVNGLASAERLDVYLDAISKI